MGAWTGFMAQIRDRWQALVNAAKILRFQEMRGIS